MWVEKYPRSYFKKVKARANAEILKYVEEKTPLLSDPYYLISTKVYWVLHDMTDFPKCVVCGKPITKNIKVTEGYVAHCSAKCVSADDTVKLHMEEAFSKKYGEGITNPFQADEVKRKITRTMLEKYGATTYTQTQEYRDRLLLMRDEIEEKRLRTMEQNNSFFSSKMESVVEDIIRKRFPDVLTQYKSEKYPFRCDFYIPSKDQYVEYNGTWTHGRHPFDETNPDDLLILENWKRKNNKYHDNAIETWTVRDVNKRRVAKENGLNFVELWNISEVYEFAGIDLKSELEIPFFRKVLFEEFSFYVRQNPSSLPVAVSRRNQIVKFFQQDVMFKTEKSMWKNDSRIRSKVIENREKYLKKPFSRMSVQEILLGFKISGVYYGYSHFNPLWFKWFISHVGCESVYDPFGGWGHRLLGGLSLKKYIYNDKSWETKENVDRIVDYFRIKNTVTHSEDALEFVPDAEFDSIFSCPPYFNLEEYPCGKFVDRNAYDQTLRFVQDLYLKTRSCRSMGLVLREDFLLPEMSFSERFPLNESSGSLSSGKKNLREFLYVFRKD